MAHSDADSTESPEARHSPPSRPGVRHRAVWEALAVGLLIGFADCFYAGHGEFSFLAYLAAGALLGLRHAGRASPCWPILGVSLYAAHIAAIACGRKPPYVEEGYRFAEKCLGAFIPSGFGLMIGVAARVGLNALGWFRRESGPPVRFLPRTTRDVLVVVAVFAFALGCIHRAFLPPTIYAAGYDEARFRAIRPGMSRDQVLSALGAPLEKHPFPDGEENWAYSDQYTYYDNYERRWIIFGKDGLVRYVVNDYWID